jgi:4-amino-4-deoxy-L-arabinose transferase-like glycosyltransferase
MNSKIWVLRIITIITALIFCFWNLGNNALNEFDEARYGVNAYEMMQNGDYINLYFAGNPDTWVFRPPLWSWCIIISYKIFGYNTWALRFPAAVCALGYFFFTYRWVKLYRDEIFALSTVILLAINKGITGFHVSRSADMDAVLLLGLSIFLYYFSKYLSEYKLKQAVLAGFGLCIAFYTKTTASILFLPGIVVFLILEKKLKTVLQKRNTWAGLGIYIGGVALWFVITHFFGHKEIKNMYNEHSNGNVWSQMIVYDTWKRFTANEFDGHPVPKNYMFFIENIDSVFNPWNYIFYLALLWVIFQHINAKRKGQTYKTDVFLKYALCTALPIILLLTFGRHKLHWYSAPVLVFLAVWVMEFLFYIHTLHRFAWILTLLLFTIFGTKHFINNILTTDKNILNYPYDTQKEWVFLDIVPAHVFLYTLWNNNNTHYSKSVKNPPLMKNVYYVTNTIMDSTFFTLIHQDKQHRVYTLKHNQ